MKLNWAERWAVNNPLRPVQQRLEIRWMRKRVQLKPGAIVAEVGCGREVGACILKEEFQLQLLQAMDLKAANLHLAHSWENKKIGILGISTNPT